MSFWETEGANVQENKINKLLKSSITLEKLMQEESFLEEYMTQNSNLIKYMCNQDILNDILKWMITTQPISQYSFVQCQNFTYKSFRVLAEYNKDFTNFLYFCFPIMNKLFEIIKMDQYQYIVAQGYLQSIIRNHLSNINENKIMFCDILTKHKKEYIFPLVENPSKANCEIIRDILTNGDENLITLQKDLFNYLIIFYLNERFEENSYLDENFQNLQKIFLKLAELRIKYEYKQKYIPNLFSLECIKKKQMLENLYAFRLSIIYYLSSSQQITSIPNPEQFLDSYKIFAGKRKCFFLLQILDTFLAIEKENKYSNDFYQKLLTLAMEYKSSDIICNKILKILLRQKNDWYISNLVLPFLQQQGNKFKDVTGTKYTTNEIPASFCEQILKEIDYSKLTINLKNDLQIFQKKIEDVYKSTIYSVPKDQLPPPIDGTTINIDEINLFGSNQEGTFKDLRFHDEDYLFKEQTSVKPTLDDFNFQSIIYRLLIFNFSYKSLIQGLHYESLTFSPAIIITSLNKLSSISALHQDSISIFLCKSLS